MNRIDAHAHLNTNRPEDFRRFDALDLNVINICVATNNTSWRDPQRRHYRQQAEQRPDRFAWCTTFDLPELTETFDAGDYADRVIHELKEDFAAGAIACKIWKNVGMDLQDRHGNYIMADDPVFEPIYDHLEQSGMPLLAHLAEPMDCWRPLGPDNLHSGYYEKNPQWHMYGRAGFPSHETIMAARDHVVAKHPRLSVIGAHLGSLERDLDALAERLDKYPNFAVDTSARLRDLVPHGLKAKAFIEHYRDRILWGSDLGLFSWKYPQGSAPDAAWEEIEAVYQREFDFYTTDKSLTIHGRPARGIKLPADIQKLIFHDNAKRWYPAM